MKLRQSLVAAVVLTLSALPGFAATLGVTANATPDGALFDYSYAFSVSGLGAVNNVFLGSDDLSPLNVVIDVNGAPTSDWSWLGNDTPQNYLQFFDTDGNLLRTGDVLDVTFTSAIAPASTGFAVGLNSLTSIRTNIVNDVPAPMIAAATPEPGSLVMLLCGMALVTIGWQRSKRSRE